MKIHLKTLFIFRLDFPTHIHEQANKQKLNDLSHLIERLEFPVIYLEDFSDTFEANESERK